MKKYPVFEEKTQISTRKEYFSLKWENLEKNIFKFQNKVLQCNKLHSCPYIEDNASLGK